MVGLKMRGLRKQIFRDRITRNNNDVESLLPRPAKPVLRALVKDSKTSFSEFGTGSSPRGARTAQVSKSEGVLLPN